MDLFLYLLVGLLSLLHISPRLANCQLQIISPPALLESFNDTGGMIQGSTATFGAPAYGETLLGRVMYRTSASSHCDEDYTLKDEPTKEGAEPEESGQALALIAFVDRGHCTFVKKVNIAEKLGADAVVVIDNGNRTVNNILHIIMADDGNGRHISIPSLLITADAGKKIVDANGALVELEWRVPAASVVNVDFWGDSGKDVEAFFLSAFAEYAIALGPKLRFFVHYVLFRVQDDQNSLCYRVDGKTNPDICASDPDGSGPLTGSDVVQEDMRQLCIYEVYKDTSVENAEFCPKCWAYFKVFYAQCKLHSLEEKDPTKKFGEECSKSVMKKVGIDFDKVNKECITAASNDTEAVGNQTLGAWLLEEEINNQAWGSLAVQINGWRFSGSPTAQLVIQAVCSAYSENNPPPECAQFQREFEATFLPKSLINFVPGVSWGAIGALLVCLLIPSVIGFFWYQRNLRKSVRAALREEVMLEVKTQLQDYHPLSDDAIPESHRQSRPLIG